MLNSIRALGLASAVALAPFAASAAVTVTNGSFELPDITGPYVTTPPGTAPAGWTINPGNVDFINTYWQAAEGTQSIDLSGNVPGTISQTVSGFVSGARYLLTFFMAGNPDPSPALKTLTASVGTASGNFSFDTTGKTKENMGWEERTFEFIASGTGDLTLSFAGTTLGNRGAALDNVSIALVPLPAGGVLLLTALGAVAVARRRKSA